MLLGHFVKIAVDIVDVLSRSHVDRSAAVVVAVLVVGTGLEEGVHEVVCLAANNI